LIEQGKLIGIVLTIEEYDKLQGVPRKELKTPQETKLANPTPGENFSADLADMDIEEDVTLEDLGLDELPY